jgi:HTH-type transcriptional regulator/antitoxin HipB
MSNSDEQPFRIYAAASLGTAIRQYRREAGLTQAELATRVGIDQSYLSRLEQGQETEQVRRIIAILKQLGVRASLRHEEW